MRVTRREITLGMVVLVLLLGGVGYFMGRSMAEDWSLAIKQRRQLAQKKSDADNLIKNREAVVEQLRALDQALPRFGLTQQVNAELLKTIQKTADENMLALKRLLPDKEKVVGDLSELAIECHYEGTLEELVRFLYAVQVQGAMLDIRQLKIDPAQGAAGRLRGTFTVHCAFKRENVEPPKSEEQPAAEASS